MSILNDIAVGRKSQAEAAELLSAYVATPGIGMVMNHTPDSALGQKPKGTAAGDQLFEP